LRQEKEVDPNDSEDNGDASTDVRADRGSFLTGNASPVHQIVIKRLIESVIDGVRQDGNSQN
jgi:hypothetical protein